MVHERGHGVAAVAFRDREQKHRKDSRINTMNNPVDQLDERGESQRQK